MVRSTERKVASGFERTVAADASAVGALRDDAAAVARAAGADEQEACDVRIAVGEALANACRHGSPAPGKSAITMRCAARDGRVEIEVQDEGAPFDPNTVPPPDPFEMRSSGMGIHLMRQTMDEVEFGRGSSGNCVRMVKRLAHPAEQGLSPGAASGDHATRALEP